MTGPKPNPSPNLRGLAKAEKIKIQLSQEANDMAVTRNMISMGFLLVAIIYPVLALANHKAERLEDKMERKMERLEDKISNLQQQKLSVQLQSR